MNKPQVDLKLIRWEKHPNISFRPSENMKNVKKNIELARRAQIIAAKMVRKLKYAIMAGVPKKK